MPASSRTHHPIELPVFECFPARRLAGIRRRSARLLTTGAVDEEPPDGDIGFIPEQRRRSRSSVAPGAPDLLVVRLDRSRDRIVHHRLHIRPIDPHAKRVGGAHDAERARREGVLHAGARLVVEPGVIGRALCRAARGRRRRPRRCVGSPRRRAPGGRDERRQARVLLDVVRRRLHAQEDVRPVEPGNEHPWGSQSQHHDDVVAHLAGCGGGKRGDRRPRAGVHSAGSSPPRRAAAGNRGGSRVPTATRSGPRRPRSVRLAARQQPHESGPTRSVPARRRAAGAAGARGAQRPPAGATAAASSAARLRGCRAGSARRPGPSSARSAATRRASSPAGSRPGAGSRGTCPIRWASPRARLRRGERRR